MQRTSAGGAHLPLRQMMRLPGGGALGMMPGYLDDPECFGIKLVSLFPGNAALGLSSHLGLYALYQAATGEPCAIMDASALTAVRTAAASAVATRALMRPGSRTLAIIGAGEQAQNHIAAFDTLQAFEQVRIWARNADRAQELAYRAAALTSAAIIVEATVQSAVDGADVACTLTAATEPILHGEWLRPGTHLCVVGSSTPDRREVDDECVIRSRFFVDYRGSALAQAGELLHAQRAGLVSQDHIVAEIGDVLSGACEGRLGAQDITVYKSLGVASQDLAAGMHVFRKAEKQGRGAVVTL